MKPSTLLFCNGLSMHNSLVRRINRNLIFQGKTDKEARRLNVVERNCLLNIQMTADAIIDSG